MCKQITPIYNWLVASTALPARALPLGFALRYFLEIQKLRHHRQEESAQRLLRAARKEIDQFLVSVSGPTW